MITIFVALGVNLPTMVILMIFISKGHLGLQFPSNGSKSITKGRVHGKCRLKFGY
jgi:hypothetical protein